MIKTTNRDSIVADIAFQCSPKVVQESKQFCSSQIEGYKVFKLFSEDEHGMNDTTWKKENT